MFWELNKYIVDYIETFCAVLSDMNLSGEKLYKDNKKISSCIILSRTIEINKKSIDSINRLSIILKTIKDLNINFNYKTVDLVNMKKEIIICIIVVIAIIVLNAVTGNYTKESVASIKNELDAIKEDIKQEKDTDTISKEISELKSNWENRNNILMFYIEHNELEKVQLYIVGLDSNVNSKEYNQAIEELDKCAFILEHLEDKYSFELGNIF